MKKLFLTLGLILAFAQNAFCAGIWTYAQLTAPASADKMYIIDVSDTTDGAQGTGKYIEYSDLYSPFDTEAEFESLFFAITTPAELSAGLATQDECTEITGCVPSALTTVDISANTNLAAGRSLTLSGDSVEADAELYTDQQGAYVSDPAAGDFNNIFWFMNDITVTYVWCKTDTGTVTLNIEDGSDNDILTADIVCDSDGQTSCASGCDVNTINGTYDNITGKTEDGDLSITSVATSPTELSIYVGFTKDD